jgi:cellulose synthase/poly-beta-1,6-N-acetylglucosamine synthase-like glycosyltransferase/peptidoglycan/xylan/chitin deacetylase (PgdA/CDA1 family)/spore germination protein YaaH
MTQDRQIFFDPQRKRWKRLRRIFDISALLFTVVVTIFIANVFRQQQLPELLLPLAKHNFKPINDRQSDLIRAERAERAKGKPTRRKTTRKASDIPFNTGEGLRAAYYLPDNEASYSSFKEHVSQIDILFPVWLHVSEPDGNLMGESSDDRQEFRIVDKNGVHDPDDSNKIKNVIAAAKEDTEVFPLLSSFNPQNQSFDPAIGAVVLDNAKRQILRQQIMAFFKGEPQYHGLSLDLENFPDDAQSSYLQFIQELYADMHARNLKLYINVEVSMDDDSLKTMAANSDGLVIMNYDEHEIESQPGPIASQTFFLDNLKRALKVVPKEKILCAVGNYGYDWTMSLPGATNPKDKKRAAAKFVPKVIDTEDITVQEAWQRASDADADLDLDYNSLNPHFSYIDEDDHVQHVVWFLDSVTLLDEMRGARELGIQTFALWALGKEDRSLWKIWDKPSSADAQTALNTVPPGHDLDEEGVGDVLRVTGTPKPGRRTVQIDTDDETDPRRQLVIDEHMDVYPLSYQVHYYGYHPGQVALSFDDGPDPTWTPKILNILKEKQVKGTFMLIGSQAQENVGLMQRLVREGHEIGNHTYTHPDIAEISARQLELELNVTERLFISKLGVQPLYFRPPYDIDEEPDTDDQAEPAYRVEQMGYIVVGNKIDTDDWNEHPHKTPKQITDSVMQQLDNMKDKPQFQSSIILMHDGGGNRAPTVAALPVLIDALRARGYQIVPVSALMGKTTAEVMPKTTGWQYWRAQADSVAFSLLSLVGHFIVWVFFVGDVLMSARLILIGILAVIDRLRKKHAGTPGFTPPVAVLVPAYNEETVIVRTVRSVLNSTYPNLHVVVIDDGSSDNTAEVARAAYGPEIASGKVAVLTKANGGKAAALNYAVGRLSEEFYVGIDADTVIAPDAIGKLMPHFEDPRVGAVAGNAKVGNRVNLWTRWQALEYITSQNFERRALDLFNIVTVVPGAIGAWRTGPVKAAGGYPLNTVAEDADLTMSLLEQGLKVVYEDQSLAFTEAPIDAKGLMRQRFRWSFGTLQAVWKHRAAFLRNKAMGLFALPNIIVFQMLLPMVSPFIDLMFLYGVGQFLYDRYNHPEAASVESFERLLVYFLTFMVIDFVTSAVAFSLERKHPSNKGDGWLLFHIWLQRFAYRQVFSVVLFKTVKRAIDGRPFNWDKIARTAKMSKQTEKLMEGA